MVRPLPPYNARPLKQAIVKRAVARARIMEDAGAEAETEAVGGALKSAIARARPELRVLGSRRA